MRIDLLNLDDVYIALAEAKHYDALWNSFIAVLTRLDIDLISYHHITPLSTSETHHNRVDILSHGFPRAWETHYRAQKFHLHDPIFNLSYKMLRPLKWSDVTERGDLTPKQKSFISEFSEWMKGGGYSIPAFGPSGQNACFGIGNTATIAGWDSAWLRRIGWICSQFHLSYCALRLKEFTDSISLTDKDREILHHWGQGTHIVTIAEKLDETPESVQTALNEVMKKMKVTDSQSLMIRAAHLGLIKPKP
jgi:DNA-binding CsgD family transcriptional regulator